MMRIVVVPVSTEGKLFLKKTDSSDIKSESWAFPTATVSAEQSAEGEVIELVGSTPRIKFIGRLEDEDGGRTFFYCAVVDSPPPQHVGFSWEDLSDLWRRLEIVDLKTMSALSVFIMNSPSLMSRMKE
jgi:hypothetical protein